MVTNNDKNRRNEEILSVVSTAKEERMEMESKEKRKNNLILLYSFVFQAFI